MARYSDSVTLAVPSADALALCRQAVEALGWPSQAIQQGGFRCAPAHTKEVTLDVSVTEAEGGALVTLSAEKRFAFKFFVEPYLRSCVEKLKQKVTELAGASPGGPVPSGAPGAPGSALSPEDRAAFTASRSDRDKPPEARILPVNRERQREGSGGPIGGGYNPTEDVAKQATTALIEALSRAIGQAPPPPMPRQTRLNYLRDFERDADAGKITLTPRVRDELATIRAALQKDLINHPED